MPKWEALDRAPAFRTQDETQDKLLQQIEAEVRPLAGDQLDRAIQDFDAVFNGRIKAIRTMGIDIGRTNTAYAVLDDGKFVCSNHISPLQSCHSSNLLIFQDQIFNLVDKHSPDYFCVERYLFRGAQSRDIELCSMMAATVALSGGKTITPAQWKSWINRKFGEFIPAMNKLFPTTKDEHECDAAGMALYLYDSVKIGQ